MVTVRCDAIVLAGLLVGSCSSCSGPPAPPYCDETRWAAVWDDSLVPAGRAPEWFETRPVVFARPDGAGFDTHFWLPFDFNRRQAYFIAGEDDVFVRIRFMSGTEFPATGRASARVLVNGVPVSVDQGGSLGPEASTAFVGGLADLTLMVPRATFRAGLSHVHIYARYDYDRPGGAFEFEDFWTFSVLNGGAAAAALPETAGYSPGESAPESDTTVYFMDGGVERPFVRFVDELPNGGDLSIRIDARRDPRLGVCPAGTVHDKFAVIALLDGVLVPMGSYPMIVAMPSPAETRRFSFELALPNDEMPHRFEILYLPGLDRPARLAGGSDFPPWNPRAQILSIVRWNGG